MPGWRAQARPRPSWWRAGNTGAVQARADRSALRQQWLAWRQSTGGELGFAQWSALAAEQWQQLQAEQATHREHEARLAAEQWLAEHEARLAAEQWQQLQAEQARHREHEAYLQLQRRMGDLDRVVAERARLQLVQEAHLAEQGPDALRAELQAEQAMARALGEVVAAQRLAERRQALALREEVAEARAIADVRWTLLMQYAVIKGRGKGKP